MKTVKEFLKSKNIYINTYITDQSPHGDKSFKLIDILEEYAQQQVSVEPVVMLNFAEEEKTIMKVLLLSKIVEFTQALDDIFLPDDQDEVRLKTQLETMKTMLSKISV